MNKLIAETWKDGMRVDSAEVFYGLPHLFTWGRFHNFLERGGIKENSEQWVLAWRFLKGGENSQIVTDDCVIEFIWTLDGDDDKVIAELMQERNRIMQEILDILKCNQQLVEQILDKQRAQSHSEKN